MRTIRIFMVLLLLSVASATALAAQRPGQPEPTEEFVPIDQLPPEEQMPAAPMVIAAYGFVWIAFLIYVTTLVKRVRRVEIDLQTLERDRR